MIFADAWAQAIPSIMASIATIMASVCTVAAMWIRYKSASWERRVKFLEEHNREQDARVAECEKKLAAQEQAHQAETKSLREEIAKRDARLAIEWPSDEFTSKETAAKIVAAAVPGIKITMERIGQMVELVKERRCNHNRPKQSEEYLP